MVYVPTFTQKKPTIHVGKYTIVPWILLHGFEQANQKKWLFLEVTLSNQSGHGMFNHQPSSQLVVVFFVDTISEVGDQKQVLSHLIRFQELQVGSKKYKLEG